MDGLILGVATFDIKNDNKAPSTPMYDITRTVMGLLDFWGFENGHQWDKYDNELSNCVTIKEWTPREHTNFDHKFLTNTLP